jgi:hypothetical protein
MKAHWTAQAVTLLDPVDTAYLTPGPVLDRSDLLSSPNARRRPRWPLVAVGAVVLLGGASALAATQLGGGDTHIVNLQCVTPSGDTAGQVRTGDPIADCAAIWKQESDLPVPPLKAYVFNNVTFYVQPANSPAPTDPRMRPLTGHTQTDPALTELQSALADRLAGPESRCMTTDEARATIASTLTRVGLNDVPITLLNDHGKPRTADGATGCADAALDTSSEHTEVALFSVPASLRDVPDRDSTFVNNLRAAATSCTTLNEAIGTVRRVAATSGVASDQLDIASRVDEAATCTRMYVEYGGEILVSLTGPR